MKAGQSLSKTFVRRVADGDLDRDLSDVLAVEEPLEIRVGFVVNGKIEHRAISITMRTPGADLELAAGFLFTEGLLKSPDQVKQIRHCGKGTLPTGRVSAAAGGTLRRGEQTTQSLCGTVTPPRSAVTRSVERG